MCPSYATLQTLQIFRPLKMAFYAVRNHHGLMFTVHFVDFQLRWDTKHDFAQTYKSVIIASSQFCHVLILSGPNPSGMAQLYHNHFLVCKSEKCPIWKTSNLSVVTLSFTPLETPLTVASLVSQICCITQRLILSRSLRQLVISPTSLR